jgi:hypothetical protein
MQAMGDIKLKDRRRALIGDVNQALLRSYLEANGWRHTADLKRLATIWHKMEQERGFSEVVLPSNEAKDYLDRMHDALLAIASFENVELQDLVQKVTSFFADRISVRVIHADVSDGTIPLEDGVALNQRARDLMAAAALTTISKRKHYSGKRSPETKAFLDTLRLGQTSHGSYIINVIAPVQPTEELQASIPTSSLTRVVTNNLVSSLSALSEATATYAMQQELNVFDSAIEGGVSANMCDALVGISGEKESRQFEIVITPATVEDSPSSSRTFSFDAEAINSIRKASDYYKDNFVLPDKVVTGFVKRLDRPTENESGTITIEAKVYEAEKHIQIELHNDDYLEAVSAHKAKEPVQCRGDLHVSPRKVRLLNPTEFKVLRSEDLL